MTVYTQGNTSTHMQAPRAPKAALHQPHPSLVHLATISRGPRELAKGADVGPEVGADVGTLSKPAPQVLSGSCLRSRRQLLTQGLGRRPAMTLVSRWPPAQPDCRATTGRGRELGSSGPCRGAWRKFWVPQPGAGAGDPTSGWKGDRALGARHWSGSLAPSPVAPFPAFWHGNPQPWLGPQ